MRPIPNPPGKVVRGDVIFEGRSLLKLSDDEMRRIRGEEIATIFQDPMTSLNPVSTICWHLTESLELQAIVASCITLGHLLPRETSPAS